MKIIIQTIPHNTQRYPTVGDWLPDVDDSLTIFVSQTGNWKYNLLVGIHELVEASLCKDRNIPEELITKFDTDYEANRNYGDDSEPGDDPGAPYRREHFFATNIERLIAEQLGVDWTEYEKTLYSL